MSKEEKSPREKEDRFKQMEFEIVESENYRELPVDDVSGSLVPDGGKMVLYTNTIVPKVDKHGRVSMHKIKKIKQAEIHLSVQSWISIARWMLDRWDSLKDGIKDGVYDKLSDIQDLKHLLEEKESDKEGDQYT